MPTDLTTTSYAILGRLSLRSWSTNELAEQAPCGEWHIQRAEEARALGPARRTTEYVGLRPRNRYTITAKGRRALAAWVPTAGAGPVVEFEQLTKVFFAEQAVQNTAATCTFSQFR